MILRKLAALALRTPPLRRGADLWQRNRAEFNMPLGAADKLRCGLHLILSDWLDGSFPPRFPDRQAAYDAEIQARDLLPGCTPDAFFQAEMRKPFWAHRAQARYLGGYLKVLACLETCGVHPPAAVLELGSGSGWMAEFLAVAGYRVTGSAISPADVRDASLRIGAIKAKGIRADLDFLVAPMEEIDRHTGGRGPFDAVFVFEALHHAFAWREAIESARRCLKPGGWLLIASEPNVLHTAISYRVARLTNTHEIGFSKKALRAHLAASGFGTVRDFGPRLHAWVAHHWLAAQRPAA